MPSSGGRLILGLGAGFKPQRGHGIRPAVPGLASGMAMLEEHFEIISRLTRRDPPARRPSAAATPGSRTASTPRPPAAATTSRLLIGGHGRRETFSIAARFCDYLNINLAPVEVAPYLEALDERCAEVGRDRTAWPLLLQNGLNPSTAIRTCG